uniref:Fatty-acid and retinol-binding protein 1 n=1 Tax=Rhabditophanes sp. KR3021 TaxID=114890 RepID=A0AC35TSU9_9BILA
MMDAAVNAYFFRLLIIYYTFYFNVINGGSVVEANANFSIDLSTKIPNIFEQTNTTLNQKLLKGPFAIVALLSYDCVTFLKGLNEEEKQELVQLPFELADAIEQSRDLSSNDIMAPISQLDPDLKQKLSAFGDTMKVKAKNISVNSQQFFSDFFDGLLRIYQYLINARDDSFNEKDVYSILYDTIQKYLQLTNEDRQSIANAFPSLGNIFTNQGLLNQMKTITPTSEIQDYLDLKNYFLSQLNAGTFTSF